MERGACRDFYLIYDIEEVDKELGTRSMGENGHAVM